MEERRSEERISVSRSIEVIDEYLDEKVGILVDISPKGLRVASAEPVEMYDDMKMRLCMPGQILGKREIRLTALCVWSKQDENTQQWLSGFEFQNVSQENSTLIIGLIMELRRDG